MNEETIKGIVEIAVMIGIFPFAWFVLKKMAASLEKAGTDRCVALQANCQKMVEARFSTKEDARRGSEKHGMEEEKIVEMLGSIRDNNDTEHKQIINMISNQEVSMIREVATLRENLNEQIQGIYQKLLKAVNGEK